MDQKNEFGQTIGYPIKNWLARRMPPKTIMYGSHCLLEPLDIDKHSFKLFESLQFENQGESWTYLPYGPFNTYNEFLDWLVTVNLDTHTVFYAVIDIKMNIPIGLVSYLHIDPENGVIEVGHLHYSKLLQKTRAATEAMYLMMFRVFEELVYRRYEWKCDSLNKASRAAAERLGFKFEGIFRQHWIYKNRSRDTAWFSIIDKEWPDIKLRFQKWLNPNNFDSEGNQILSLKKIS